MGRGAALVVVIAAVLRVAVEPVPEPLMEVLTYASSSFLLDGALTAGGSPRLAMVGGVMLGLVLALMRLSTLPPLNGTAWFYICSSAARPSSCNSCFSNALPVVGIRLR